MLRDGVKIINETIGQFEKIKTKLENGVNIIELKVAENNSKINALNEDNTVKEVTKKRAETVINNLNKLLSE